MKPDAPGRSLDDCFNVINDLTLSFAYGNGRL